MELTARYRRPYHRLDEPLQVILQSLSLDQEEVKETNYRLHSLLNNYLLPEMRSADPLFEQLFVQLHYMGSFYEGLRIKEPNEFDLNVELRLPDACCAQITSANCPGFMKIKCESRGVSSELKKWISEDGFLIRDKVLQWMQGVVVKAVGCIFIPNIQISRSRSGPALTLNITENGYLYSVDLVPVFAFNMEQWPKPPVRQPLTTVPSSLVSARRHEFHKDIARSWPQESANSHSGRRWYNNKTSKKVWNAVPKGPLTNGDTTKHWRMSFYNQEKRIMNNLGRMKPSIKLMKLLRDEEGWHQLSSYYIKTVALWVNSSNKNIWQSSLGVVFMEILSAFKTFLGDKKSIPFFWDERHNLLSGLNKKEIDRIANRIARIIKTIDRTLENSPEELNTVLYSLFGPDERNTGVRWLQEYIVDFCHSQSYNRTSLLISLILTVGVLGALLNLTPLLVVIITVLAAGLKNWVPREFVVILMIGAILRVAPQMLVFITMLDIFIALNPLLDMAPVLSAFRKFSPMEVLAITTLGFFLA